jgi:hypothetical protein
MNGGDKMEKVSIASEIGSYAFSKLQKAVAGKVIGITSKGAFLLFDRVAVFLTESTYHSPFNVVLPANTLAQLALETNEEALCHEEEINFPRIAQKIDLSQALVWKPWLAPIQTLNRAEQDQRLQQLTGQLMALDPDKGYLFLAGNASQDSSEQATIRNAAVHFSIAYHRNDIESCLEASQNLFGRGNGLTPSGDDWITGFILFKARLQSKNPFLSRLSAELIYSAYKQTTYISVNRLEAASAGNSEEIFLSATDWLLDGARSVPEQLAQTLMGFGHSSGVDTWVGIAAACVSASPQN